MKFEEEEEAEEFILELYNYYQVMCPLSCFAGKSCKELFGINEQLTFLT